MSKGDLVRNAERLVGSAKATKILTAHYQHTGELFEVHCMGWHDLWKRQNSTITDIEAQIGLVDAALNALKKLGESPTLDLNFLYLASTGWPSMGFDHVYLDPFNKEAPIVLQPLVALRQNLTDQLKRMRSGQRGTKEAQRAIAIKLAEQWVLSNGCMPKVSRFQGSSPGHSWSKAVFDICNYFGHTEGWMDVCDDALQGLKATQSRRYKRLLKIRSDFPEIS